MLHARVSSLTSAPQAPSVGTRCCSFAMLCLMSRSGATPSRPLATLWAHWSTGALSSPLGKRKERERREKGERERREKGESEESVCSTHNTPSLSLSLMLAAHFPRFPLAVSRLRSPHAPWLQQQQTTTNNNKQQQQQHSTTTVVLGSYAAAAEISCADFEQSSASLFQNQGFATDVSECNVNNIVLNITMYVRSTTSFETEESVYVCE